MGGSGRGLLVVMLLFLALSVELADGSAYSVTHDPLHSQAPPVVQTHKCAALSQCTVCSGVSVCLCLCLCLSTEGFSQQKVAD